MNLNSYSRQKNHNSKLLKKFLVLAGKPAGSLDIVRYAQELGCYVIVCDYLKAEQSPAKQIADECWDYSTNDIEAIVSHAKKANVDAVFTGVHESNIENCLKICQNLKLPFYLTRKELDLCTDKRAYKKVFMSCGVNVIPEYTISNKQSIKEIEYPVLLKPVDSSGAYGLQICKSHADIVEKKSQCMAYSSKNEFIVEKYIEDKDEITSLYIIKDGIAYLASVADRIIKCFDTSTIPLPIQYVWNSKYLKLYQAQIDEKIKDAITKMQLKHGMLFIQSIVKNNIIMPYDMGFRLSGTQEHVVLEEVCGYNPLKLLVDLSLTGEFGCKELLDKINPEFNKKIVQITFLVKPSTIGCFKGLEKLELMDNVFRVIKNKYENDVISNSALGTLNQIALRVFVHVLQNQDVDEVVSEIRNIVDIYSIDGTSIVI